MTAYFDELETRTPEEREAQLFSALPARIAHAKSKSPYFAELFAEVEPNDVKSRRGLAALPVTRKSQLVDRQKHAVARESDRRKGEVLAGPRVLVEEVESSPAARIELKCRKY